MQGNPPLNKLFIIYIIINTKSQCINKSSPRAGVGGRVELLMKGGIWLFQTLVQTPDGIRPTPSRTMPLPPAPSPTPCVSPHVDTKLWRAPFLGECSLPFHLSHLRMAYFGFGLSPLRGNTFLTSQLNDRYLVKCPTSPQIAGTEATRTQGSV